MSDAQQPLTDAAIGEDGDDAVKPTTRDASAWQPESVRKNRCQHCGSHVSRAYWRANSVDGRLECCPNCEDRTRGRDHRARDAKATRDRVTPPTTYDPNAAGGGQ